MPIADLQRRDTEVGRIRLGKKTASGRADKLDTFRFTSPDEAMIAEIARFYGGTAAPWMNEKKRQFEVITDKDVIPVYIPPQVIDPWYESWGAGVCQRRCDGIRDIIHDQPCDCATDQQGKKSKCKPTTRVNLYLAEIPGMGVWRLETHGIYAAGEMVQLSDRINGIKVSLPARLHLEQRGRKFFNREKNKVETLDYPVPVLWLDSVTTQHVALGGDAVSRVVRAAAAQSLGAEIPVAAIEAPSAPALPAAPVTQTPPEPDPEMVKRALAMIATAEPEAMDGIHERIVKTGSPRVLLDAFAVRLGEHTAAAANWTARPLMLDGGEPDDGPGWGATRDDEFPPDDEFTVDPGARPAAPAAPPAAQQPPARTEAPPTITRAPEASGGTSGDSVAAMTRLLALGNAKGYKRAQLDELMNQHFGVTLKTATAQQLDALAAVVG